MPEDLDGAEDAMDRQRSKLKFVGEVLAAVGVVSSLLFVALEIRQNTAAVRGATLQAVSQQSLDLTMAGLDNPELRTAFSVAGRTPELLTEEQKRLLGWFLVSKLRVDENRLLQMRLGTLDGTFGQLSNHMVYRFEYFASGGRPIGKCGPPVSRIWWNGSSFLS